MEVPPEDRSPHAGIIPVRKVQFFGLQGRAAAILFYLLVTLIVISMIQRALR